MAVTRRDNWGGGGLYSYIHISKEISGAVLNIYISKLKYCLYHSWQTSIFFRSMRRSAHSTMEHNGAEWSTMEHNGAQWSTTEHNEWSTIDQCHAPAEIDIYILIDFTSPMVCSLGLNNRAGLVPSPLAYARNGGPRR